MAGSGETTCCRRVAEPSASGLAPKDKDRLSSIQLQIGHAYRETKRSSKVLKFVKSINNYAPVLDVLIQQHPIAVSLLWGFVRFLIQVTTRESQFANDINDTLVLITSQIGRYEQETRLFSSNPRVSEAISQLYTEISKFLIQTALYRSKSRGFGSRVIILRPKIKKTQVKVKVLADLLDQEINIALEGHEYQGPRANDDSSFDVETDTRTLSNSGSVELDSQQAAFAAAEEPASIELEVIPPISDTYVSKYTQTPENDETKKQIRFVLEEVQAEEANRRLEEQTHLIRQLLTQQWESAEEQRRSSVSVPFQKTVALVVIFISIASLVAALWIGKVQIDLAQHTV